MKLKSNLSSSFAAEMVLGFYFVLYTFLPPFLFHTHYLMLYDTEIVLQELVRSTMQVIKETNNELFSGRLQGKPHKCDTRSVLYRR